MATGSLSAFSRVVRRYGLDAVAAACAQALADKTVSSDVILTLLSRTHDEPHRNRYSRRHSTAAV